MTFLPTSCFVIIHLFVKVIFCAQVDVAIIEVGLGGKMDSTNVVIHLLLDSPRLTTSRVICVVMRKIFS